MKCPYCLEDIEIPACVLTNVGAYQKTSYIATPCCNRGIHVRPVSVISVTAAPGGSNEDNWGDKVAKSEFKDIKLHDPQLDSGW